MIPFWNVVIDSANIRDSFHNKSDVDNVGLCFRTCGDANMRALYANMCETVRLYNEYDLHPTMPRDPDLSEYGEPTFYDNVNNDLWEAGFRLRLARRTPKQGCDWKRFVCLALVPRATRRRLRDYLNGNLKAFCCHRLQYIFCRRQEFLIDPDRPVVLPFFGDVDETDPRDGGMSPVIHRPFKKQKVAVDEQVQMIAIVTPTYAPSFRRFYEVTANSDGEDDLRTLSDKSVAVVCNHFCSEVESINHQDTVPRNLTVHRKWRRAQGMRA